MATSDLFTTITTGSTTSTNKMTLNSDGTVTGPEGDVTDSNINTDVVVQEIKLYIEGIQVPFQSISISQAIGTYPSASISVPPQAGLMDIARYYQPKVHIFYTDLNTGGDRLLFWGHISSVNYRRSRNPASSSIDFNCVHKNALLKQVALEYGGYVDTPFASGSDTNPNQAAVKVDALNSTMSIIMALAGITGLQTEDKDLIAATNTKVVDADTSKLDQKFKAYASRYQGMPGAVMNFWNQLKRQCLVNPAWNTFMTQMYIPLLEDGVKYFDRVSGHYSIETQLDTSRQEYCPHGIPPSVTKNDILIPPARRLSSRSAVQAALTVDSVQAQLGFSGELDDFEHLLTNFFYSIEYEYLTLASPAAVPADASLTIDPDDPDTWAATNRMSVETVIKPQTPFYYSPVCNVVLPHMFTAINISQNEAEVPTRITVYNDVIPSNGQNLNPNYRAPATVREAIAVGISLSNTAGGQQDINLLNTTASSYNVPAKYEEGRGIVHKKIAMPNWLALYVVDKAPDVGDPNAESWPEQGTSDYQKMVDLHSAWIDRYGYDITQDDGTVTRTINPNKEALDPYSVQSKIHPFQRILFETADYEYVKQISQSRSGTVDMVFNPYIIPGYPMDIIDDSPNYASFHAVCASVTHTITSRSIGTTVGFIGAMTYAELSNYYIPPVHPWLMSALDIVNVQYSSTAGADAQYGTGGTVSSVADTLINNPTAKAAADTYYMSTLGVGSADPGLLYNFQYGEAAAVTRSSGGLAEGVIASSVDTNGAEENDYLSTMGNLYLVSRQIEGKEAIKAKFGVNFIDLDPNLYTSTGFAYTNPILSKSILLEPGASLFLDYQETADFINEAQLETEIKDNQASATTPTSPTSQ